MSTSALAPYGGDTRKGAHHTRLSDADGDALHGDDMDHGVVGRKALDLDCLQFGQRRSRCSASVCMCRNIFPQRLHFCRFLVLRDPLPVAQLRQYREFESSSDAAAKSNCCSQPRHLNQSPRTWVFCRAPLSWHCRQTTVSGGSVSMLGANRMRT